MLKPAFCSRPVEPLASEKRAGERVTDTLGSSRTASRMSRTWPSSSMRALITSMLMGRSSGFCSLREPLITTSLSAGPAATSCASAVACAWAPVKEAHASAASQASGRSAKRGNWSIGCATAGNPFSLRRMETELASDAGRPLSKGWQWLAIGALY